MCNVSKNSSVGEGISPQDRLTVGGGHQERLPPVKLPGNGVTVSESAATLGRLLAASGEFFNRDGDVVRAVRDHGGGVSLKPVKPAEFCSQLERVARLRRVNKNDEWEPATCSMSVARLLLAAEDLLAALPKTTGGIT